MRLWNGVEIPKMMWNISTPDQAKAIIEDQKKEVTGEPRNLEEQAISLIGYDLYKKLVKGYTFTPTL